MMPGFSSLTTSSPSPSRSIVPGAMFSIVMSAFFSSALTISSPRGDLRSRVTDFLLALNWWKYQGSSSGWPGRRRLPGSPVFGFSILTTSAPTQASVWVQDGPASNCVKSTTRTPSRQSNSTPFIARTPPEKHAGTIARDVSAGKPVVLGCRLGRRQLEVHIAECRDPPCAKSGPSKPKKKEKKKIIHLYEQKGRQKEKPRPPV